MASMDKQSVRGEFDKIKFQFKELKAQDKVSTELNAVVNALILLVELMLVIFLEKKTKKNSRNSGKPSSQTSKDESSVSQPGSHSKGKPEHNFAFDNAKVSETVEINKVTECDICGSNLSNVKSTSKERRTKIDILFEKTIMHVDAEIKTCPDCHSTVKASFPSDMPGPLQYGNGLKAYIINMLVCQMVALRRTQGLIKAMMGVLISEATMLRYVLRLYYALENWEKSAIEQLLTMPSMHVDETSSRVNRKNHWQHVYSSGDITCKFLHRKRGTEAINAINIIPRYGGDIIHDCWQSYLSYDNCEHGLCGSHILRELTFVVESNDYRWAQQMKELLQEACKKVSKSKRKQLTLPAYKKLQKRYRSILTRGEKQMPALLPKPSGKRGRLAKSDAHNLWERLKKYETAVLLFAKKPHVSFTNNRAERDLRMAKVKQKVSGCFRSELYAKAHCRISSYLQTMANKGYNPLIAIQIALAGKIEL